MSGPAEALEPERIRRELEEVFQRPEFREPAEQSDAISHFFHIIGDWLGGLFVAAPLLFWLLLILLLGLLLWLVFSVVMRVRKTFYVERGASFGAAAGRRVRLSADFAEEAFRRAEQGDFTEAIRCLFLSLVYRLDESSQVSFHKEYTNHEYLDLLGGRTGVREGLRVFVDALDEHWYGQRPASSEHYQRCLALYERLK